MAKFIERAEEHYELERKVNEKGFKTGQEAYVLAALKELCKKRKIVYIYDLRKEYSIPPAICTRIIGELERKGYLKRNPIRPKKDKRRVHIYLTEEGEKAVSSLDEL